VSFPTQPSPEDTSKRKGLLLHLTRLNVPCLQGGYLQLSHRKICGKLEELSKTSFHFSADEIPNLKFVRRPIFSFNYNFVDYCYNVTLSAQNGSVALTPSDNLLCNYKVHLPYGNRVRLLLQIGDEPSTTLSNEVSEGRMFCSGLNVVVWNGASNWTHCSDDDTPKPNVEVESVGNIVTVSISASGGNRFPSLRFWYEAVPDLELVGGCQFGEVLVHKYCAFVVREVKSWSDAEDQCVTFGGHLLSIRDTNAQFVVDNLLLKR